MSRYRIITTYCDYGVHSRVSVIGTHVSEKGAKRAWQCSQSLAQLRPQSSYFSPFIGNWRVWQYDHRTKEIINDTGVRGHKFMAPIIPPMTVFAE